ncbi:hypothetical protein FQN60_016473, partial [Etheostoma spectabile]
HGKASVPERVSLVWEREVLSARGQPVIGDQHRTNTHTDTHTDTHSARTRRSSKPSNNMKDNSLPRIVLIILCTGVFIAVLIVNALAGAGRGPFHSPTGNVSSRYETDITPAGWTFSIWGVIYTWLTLMVIYLTTYVFRGSWAQCLLPYSFYFCWLSNMVLNMIWLLLWDRELMLAALIVQNGLAVYTTWTSIASLINFALVLHLWGVDRSTAATASLCILFAEVVAWFVLENWVLDRWVRNILTVYPVVIVALVGNVFQHFKPAHPTPNTVFM